MDDERFTGLSMNLVPTKVQKKWCTINVRQFLSLSSWKNWFLTMDSFPTAFYEQHLEGLVALDYISFQEEESEKQAFTLLPEGKQ
jgi:hypothetical protein